eukprot:700700_1
MSEALFESASRSKVKTSIPSCCLFVGGIVIVILSIMQAAPTDNLSTHTQSDNWEYDVCKNEMIAYLSPFHLETSDDFILSCPWRTRNTVYRCVVASLLVLCSFASLLVLCTQKLGKAWPVLYRMNWILFVMMFVIFALDSAIVLNNESAIKVSQCLISSPFVWTVVCQLILSGIAYCAYRISKCCTFGRPILIEIRIPDKEKHKMSITVADMVHIQSSRHKKRHFIRSICTVSIAVMRLIRQGTDR